MTQLTGGDVEAASWRRGRLTIQLVIGVGLLLVGARSAEAHDSWLSATGTGVFRPAESTEPVPAPAPRAFRGLFEPEPAAPEPAPPRRVTALSLPEAFTFAPSPSTATQEPEGSIAWRSLLAQSVAFLLVQHSYRIAFEAGTRKELGGPFFEEWIESASTLCCWDDGDRNTTNYLWHPLMGSVTSFIFANNHRESQDAPIGTSSRYWKAKGAQGIYSFVYSLNFELGPLSEASIGNVGLKSGDMTYSDIVVTPVVGLLISVGEDALRLHVIDHVWRKNRYWGNTVAVLLNPTRAVANAMGGMSPWRGPAWSIARSAP